MGREAFALSFVAQGMEERQKCKGAILIHVVDFGNCARGGYSRIAEIYVMTFARERLLTNGWNSV